MSAGGAAAVCAALGGLEPAAKPVFLMRRHGALEGVTPVAEIANGGINRGLAFASASSAEGAH